MMDSAEEDDPHKEPLKTANKDTQSHCKLPHCGFKNHQQLGFACATFELLLNLPPFVEWLRVAEPGEGTVANALLDVQFSEQSVDVEPLKSRIKCFESGNHEGHAAIFLSDVIYTIDEEVSGDIHEVLGGTIKVSENCSSCGNFNQTTHKNTIYPIHLDTNSSIQQGMDEYNMVQFITCDKCQKDGEMMIVQSIHQSPSILIVKVEDLVGSPNIDILVEFGGASYQLTGLMFKESGHYQTISRCGSYWFQFNDSSVRPIKLGSLISSDSIKRNLYMCAYIRISDVNNNNSAGEEVTENAINNMTEKLSQTNIQEQQIVQREVTSAATPQCTKLPVWVPSTPDDLTEQLAAAAEVINLKDFDPLLTEKDVPGAILPYPIDEKKVKVKHLVRWLRCRGAPTANLTKSELIDRVNIRMTNNSRHMIDPSIDKYKWYKMKKKALEDENPTVKPPFLPILGWGAFPSVDVPELFNWGHAHVYLIETAPNWTSAFDFSDNEEECFSQDMADNVGQTNIPKKGRRFLDSGHILQVMDCQTEEFYFVKARIQASMVCKTYFTSVTIRRISGSVRDSTCFCRQRSLGRCSHVAALLMHITRHTEELGYGAMSCTDREVVWERGDKVKEKDPGLITKVYKSSTNPLRSSFNPLPTSQQYKTEEELECIKNNFLKDVQRLYVTEAMKPKKKKKKNANNEDKDFHYLFDLHLEFNYLPYEESKTDIINVIQLCKEFARARKEESLLDPFLNGPFECPNTQGQSDSPQWHNLRSFFFPSSLGKRIFHMTPQGYKTFLREHLWQMKKFRGNRATKYGTKNEPKARKAHEETLQKQDSSIKILETGMWSNYDCIELSCSPDGLITRDSGEVALIEIKCPHLLRTGNPNTFEKTLTSKQMKTFCLERKEHVQLKRDHPYFYQIQLAMGIMEILTCHFVVWSPKGMFYEEVEFDRPFFNKLKMKMVPLFWKLVVPEYFFQRTPRRMEPCLLHYNINKLD